MENNREILAQVFSGVVENLAFMFAEEIEPDEYLPEPDDAVMARMGFQGAPCKGALALAVPEEMCPEIAANVLGVDMSDETLPIKPHDALKELLNVVCGQLLVALAGEEPVFDLTVPDVRPVNPGEWEAMRQAGAAFNVDDHPVILQLALL